MGFTELGAKELAKAGKCINKFTIKKTVFPEKGLKLHSNLCTVHKMLIKSVSTT